MNVCPITKQPCTETPACDFTEPTVRGYPAGLGKTPCAKWVAMHRAEGMKSRAADDSVHAAAGDILEERRS